MAETLRLADHRPPLTRSGPSAWCGDTGDGAGRAILLRARQYGSHRELDGLAACSRHGLQKSSDDL